MFLLIEQAVISDAGFKLREENVNNKLRRKSI